MRSVFLALLSLATLCQISTAQSPDYAQELSTSLAKREVVLRHYYTDAGLSFDASGKLISAATEGFGPTDGRIYVQSVELTPDQLVLTGNRPVDFLDPVNKKWIIADMHRPVSVDIQLPANEPARDAVPKLLSAIFLTQAELANIRCSSSQKKPSGDEQQQAPSQHAPPKSPNTAPAAKPQPACVRNGERAYRFANGITPPKAKYAPDPQYTDAARRAKVAGTTVLVVIVTPNGNPSAIAVVRSLGSGLDTKLLPYAYQLDEQAVDTVSRWAFEPARLGDVPVAMVINVEVNFRLR
jgi:TonB family protein